MTTEPRQEANNLVRQFALSARRTAEGHVSPETFKQGSDKLEHVLAAALRWHNARRRAGVQSSAEVDAHLDDAECELSRALSALREAAARRYERSEAKRDWTRVEGTG